MKMKMTLSRVAPSTSWKHLAVVAHAASLSTTWRKKTLTLLTRHQSPQRTSSAPSKRSKVYSVSTKKCHTMVVTMMSKRREVTLAESEADHSFKEVVAARSLTCSVVPSSMTTLERIVPSRVSLEEALSLISLPSKTCIRSTRHSSRSRSNHPKSSLHHLKLLGWAPALCRLNRLWMTHGVLKVASTVVTRVKLCSAAASATLTRKLKTKAISSNGRNWSHLSLKSLNFQPSQPT